MFSKLQNRTSLKSCCGYGHTVAVLLGTAVSGVGLLLQRCANSLQVYEHSSLSVFRVAYVAFDCITTASGRRSVVCACCHSCFNGKL